MNSFSRVLCPVDFSDATDTGVALAVALAEAVGARLFLLFVVEFPHESVAHERIYLEVEDTASVRLREMADRHAAPKGTTSLVLRGSPYEEITEFAREQNVDLIVMPTHRRAGLDRLLSGRVAQRVIRMAHCPVLAIPPEVEPSTEFHPGTILLATDFSRHADLAMNVAEALAATLGAALLLGHVVALAERGAAGDGWRFPILPEDLEAQALADARDQLESRAAESRLRSGLEVETRLLRGTDPALELSELAVEVGTGLTVVASHGHAAVAHMLLGSTCERIVRTSAVPVLIVPIAEV